LSGERLGIKDAGGARVLSAPAALDLISTKWKVLITQHSLLFLHRYIKPSLLLILACLLNINLQPALSIFLFFSSQILIFYLLKINGESDSIFSIE